MGKAAKWLKLLLTGKKEERCGPPLVSMEMRSGPLPMPPPKEKRRWSFRRSVTGTAMEQKSANVRNRHVRGHSDSDMDKRWEAVAMVIATAAATDAAAAAAQAAAAVIRLTNTATGAVEEAAAIKIQSIFRSYLARKALRALKGLVKLQALIRGHLVRWQATATLRSMQALVTAQARARIQRMRMLEESQAMPRHRQNNCRRSPLEARSHQSYYEMEENIKIVEMDLGESRGSSKSRNSYSIAQAERRDHRLATCSASSTPYKRDPHREASPVHSTLTDKSPRACSGHFGEYFVASKSSPSYLSTSSIYDSMKSPLSVSQDYALFPNYMANTQSSRAKARSHSAPRQRPDSCERPLSRRRPSVEGRSVSRGAQMQQSSPHVSSAAAVGYRYPWSSIKLDRSSVSLQESECGSTSTVLTNTNYAKSLMAYELCSELS